MKQPDDEINLIYLDQDGKLREDPELAAAGLNGKQAELADPTWIDLPAGADLVSLPGRLPLGYNRETGQLEAVEEVTAVAAILPLGYTRTLLPAYELERNQELPLYGYTATGAAQGRLKVAAVKTDADLKWNPVYYNTSDLPRLIAEKKREFPGNRILNQLGRCALEYHCLTAENLFYRRWEAGIPVSPFCNAACLGCISRQPAECCPSPQGRIDFVPSVAEVSELCRRHLEEAPEAIVSFGQGCEGEPSLQRELLVDAVTEVRSYTNRGIINLNTNAGYFEAIRELADSGLDSIRVSLFSARADNYQWYHRPSDYRLEEVKQSLSYASDRGLMVALNLLFFPGFSNQSAETEALFELITATGVKQLQLRNLNLDPEKMGEKLAAEELPSIGEWLAGLTRNFPGLLIGNYTLSRR